VKKAKPYLQFDHYAYVGFMHVKPEFRGKGISQQVFAELIKWAKSRGLNEIRLDVYDDNQSADRAYEKFGFKKHLVEMRMTI
jgi:GNAT superfamily N-acetyltransferase